MKKIVFALSLFMLLLTQSCSNNINPVSAGSSQKDWEGNYPQFNTAYKDSLLCASTRGIGTSFEPSVFILNKDGSGMHALTNNWFTFGASWSPRRWKIIFIQDSGLANLETGLFMMNSDGTQKKCLTQPGEIVFGDAAWSPDGNTIAYIEVDSSAAYVRGRVKLMNPDGTNRRTITGWYVSLNRVTWSPDSKQIAFAGVDSTANNQIYTMNTDGTDIKVLFTYPEDCYSPSWSPDGNLIAFSTLVNIDGGYYTEILTYDFNAHRLHQITNSKSFNDKPTWSSDSKSIIFASTPSGQTAGSALFKIDVTGSNLIQLTNNNADDFDPSWY